MGAAFAGEGEGDFFSYACFGGGGFPCKRLGSTHLFVCISGVLVVVMIGMGWDGTGLDGGCEISDLIRRL